MTVASRSGAPLVVLGAGGMLGKQIVRRFRRDAPSHHARHVIEFDRSALDVGDPQSVLKEFEEARPKVVVNCAAYTDVDGCEADERRAMQVNAEGPRHIADACAKINAFLVQFSTDYVFDGESERPYRPDDSPRPLSIYGRSKWAGEQAVRASGCRHLIIRTSWLFGPGGRNFVEAILSKARKGEPLRVVNDQLGRPTMTVDLAEAVQTLLDADAKETVHFANEGQCTWYEFAQAVMEESGLAAPITPLTSRELNRPARRPAYSVLDLASYVEFTGHNPRRWRDALRAYLHAASDIQSFDRT